MLNLKEIEEFIAKYDLQRFSKKGRQALRKAVFSLSYENQCWLLYMWPDAVPFCLPNTEWEKDSDKDLEKEKHEWLNSDLRKIRQKVKENKTRTKAPENKNIKTMLKDIK